MNRSTLLAAPLAGLTLSTFAAPAFADGALARPAAHVLTRALPGGPPRGMTVTPDGDSLLVRTAGGVSLLDARTGRLVQTVAVGGDGGGLCTDREGDDIFVAGGAAPGPPVLWLTLVAGTLAFKTALAVPAGDTPARRTITGLAYGPDKAIYATDMTGGGLFKLVGKPRAVVGSARVGGRPGACALSPDARTLAVADAAAGAIRLFDPTTLRETSRVPVARPSALAWAHDGRLFVADANGMIRVIVGRRVMGTVGRASAAAPSALALSPDGRHLFLGASLSSGAGAVWTMDTPGTAEGKAGTRGGGPG